MAGNRDVEPRQAVRSLGKRSRYLLSVKNKMDAVKHRVSSVRGYDHAVVLEEGHTVEQGSVESLLARPSSRLARMLATSRRYT